MEELLPAVNLDENLTNIMNEILDESTLNCETSNTSFDSSYSSEIENVQPCNFEIFCQNSDDIPDVTVSSNTLRLILRALDKSSFSSTKKRPRQPDMWQQNIRKKLRDCGKPYIDKRGIQRAGRKMGVPCGGACFYECTRNFDQQSRLKLHKNYWSLDDAQKKAYIFLSVQPSDVKRRRKTSTQRKARSYQYYFESDDESVQVCKKFFLSTIGISERKIYYLYNGTTNEEGLVPTKPKIRGRPRINRAPAQTIGEKMQEIENQCSDSPCEDTCSHHCAQRFTEQARTELQQKFSNLSETDKELYIFGSVKQSKGKYGETFNYYIDTNIATFQVCEKFYLSTLGISESIIYNLFNTSTYEEEALEPKNYFVPSNNIDQIQEVTEHVLNFYAL